MSESWTDPDFDVPPEDVENPFLEDGEPLESFEWYPDWQGPEDPVVGSVTERRTA